ncbi:MAG: sigma D regulator [Alcanivorax sediminis]|uniref:Sigma D regulator n=1 Tax=Alcanivorax sediminis TaxID=2663008 RepID=A0A6N7LNZ2_9GAMM|nr:sigma D regulator [Alcanivorax sediminis]MQX51837.1 sigma D regulator [Alcanivorax sediminis]
MASTSPSAMAQWQRIETLVKAWLDERQQLIVLLCTLQGMRGFSSQVPQQKQLQQFCELLMDYISAGYFEVYRELVNEARHFHRENPALTHHILSQLDASTDEALAFNADFENPASNSLLKARLPQRISQLMETLEERFALEDQLILSIHQQEPPLRKAMH